MTTTGKAIVAALCAVVIGGFIWGAYQYPEAVVYNTGSPAGSSFNSAKFAGETASLASAGENGTSTSILNSDVFDRYITSVVVACNTVGTSKTAYSGGGLANWTITVATTSTAAPATLPSGYNPVLGGVLNVSTSTPNTLVASSTAGVSSTTLLWAANSYLTFQSNATNTAACTFGANYVGS